MIKIKRGLDLPITGTPEQKITETKNTQTVAVLGPDYVGMKPTMEVRVADNVKKGQVLFTDKKCPAVLYTAPAAGKIQAIHRGDKRALLSVVIQVSGGAEETFQTYAESKLGVLKREDIVKQLVQAGQWTALRTRPFSKVADPDTKPEAIFVTASDSNPLAPAISEILAGHENDFVNGLTLIAKLTDGKTYVCKDANTQLPELSGENISVETFQGPHPAGNVGTHIHFLEPVSRNKMVWHIGIQDVIAVAKLFTTGKLYTDRIISLAGPAVKNPRLIRTQLGAAVADIADGELKEGENRIISGSVLSGFNASAALAYLGRYHQQISVIPEERERRFLGWLSPGLNLFSTKNIVLSKLIPGKKFNFTSSTNGEVRAILPSGSFENIMPMDIMPLFLMRALAVDDVEEAENLGALELDEEDLALCAFVCPSKLEFGPLLRRNLTLIEKEG